MASPVPSGRLAALFQEVLTTAVRLRANRQEVPDGAAFRARLRQAVEAARNEALAAGYVPQDVQLAQFAVVAFLDETILHSGVAGLAGWAGRPLQEELFGQHLGGEWFFTQLEQLLTRPDTPTLPDLLEVYQLCLLLGFRGRYGAHDHAALHAAEQRIADRLRRGRTGEEPLAPAWRPPADQLDPRDPLWPRLRTGVLAAGILAAGLWIGATLLLRASVNDIRTQAAAQAAALR